MLVLRALGLGDLLTGVPAVKALRRALPDAEVSLAGPAAYAPLLRLMPFVDRHVVEGELEPVPWTGTPPDVAVDLHGNGPASRDLLRVLRPGRLVGFASDQLPAEPGPWWDAGEPERTRWCRLVTATFGGGCDPDDTFLDRPEGETCAPGAVVVHPGAAYPARRWPPERYADVARALAADHPVVVTAGPRERTLAERVARSAGLASGAVLAGLDLAELAALVAEAALMVSGDTGIAHLASAFATPSVTLFGPTPPALWGPPNRPQHVTLWHGSGRGNPWADRPDARLLRITVPEVLAASRAALGARSAA